MKFSIIFPSRDRVEMLTDLLNSINNTTYDKENIEVLVAVDKDDFKTQERILKIIHGGFHWIKMHVVTRSLNFSRDYYSYLYKQSQGKWIIVCNDDAEFTTQDWDVEAEKVLTGYIKDGPNVVLGWIEDNLGANRLTQFADYCCFPLFGRDGVDALGGIFPDRIPTWGADIFAHKLYGSLKRIIKIPMEIKHITHHNNTRPIDDVTKRIADNQVPYDMNPTYQEVNSLIRAMRNVKPAK